MLEPAASEVASFTAFDHPGAYLRPVNIHVHVSRRERTLRIVDDCTGMEADTLSRVVMRVGESRKLTLTPNP